MGLLYQNSVYVPLPIIITIFGPDSAYILTLFFFTLFQTSFVFSTYSLFSSDDGVKLDYRRIFNPVLIATLSAVILRFLNLQEYLPQFVISGLTMLGSIAIPLITMILGASIYLDYKQRQKILLLEIIKFLMLKNIIFPAIMLIFVLIVKPSFEVALILMIQSAVPPMTTLPVLVERISGNKSAVNQFILFSFLISMITIPLIIFIFGHFFQFPVK